MTESVTITERVASLENSIGSILEKITSVLDAAKPVASFVPGVGVVVNEVDGVAHVVESLLATAEGAPAPVDSAAIAAAAVAKSTGDVALDMRLAQIESMFEMIWPVVARIAKEFGLELPTPAAAAPMTLTV